MILGVPILKHFRVYLDLSSEADLDLLLFCFLNLQGTKKAYPIFLLLKMFQPSSIILRMQRPGPGCCCSELKTLLVNILLKFQTVISELC